MISLQDLTLLLLVHFLADASLQTNRQAAEKSTDEKQLLNHVLTYSFCMLALGVFFYGDLRAFVFAGITGFLHYWTDYHSSRLGKPYWEAKDYHNGFLIVVADQMLHILQLAYLHYILTAFK
jgi:hypothetical protein